MNRRNFQHSLAALGLCLLLTPALAQVAGKDYLHVSPPQPAGVAGKVEVIEFFSFACAHCMALEPQLAKWRAAHASDVAFRRVHVSFGRPEWAALARMYATLHAMGLSDQLDAKVFDAIHKSHVKLADEKTRIEWLSRQGVDPKKYNDVSRSFGVDAVAKRAEQLSEAYKVISVPSLYVDGRYEVQATSLEELMKNTSLLVAKARADKARK